jgi:hypothetical protein
VAAMKNDEILPVYLELESKIQLNSEILQNVLILVCLITEER